MTKRQRETLGKLCKEAEALKLFQVSDALRDGNFRAAVDWIAEALDRHTMAESKFAPAIDRLYTRIAKLKAALA